MILKFGKIYIFYGENKGGIHNVVGIIPPEIEDATIKVLKKKTFSTVSAISTDITVSEHENIKREVQTNA